MENREFLQMKSVRKSFMGVEVLHDVSFSLRKGEVHALLGENGAGKSTLINILGGIIKADSGEIFIDDKKISVSSVTEARKNGISIIHQEISLAENLTVAQNIFLGSELCKAGFLKNGGMNRTAQKFIDEAGFDLDARAQVGSLNIAHKQTVEIVKAIFFNAKIIVMDEPTSSLSEAEIETLFKRIEALKAEGISVIYISHRLEELFRIADRVSVLRDGRCVATLDINDADKNKLVSLMVGREYNEKLYPDRISPAGGEPEVVLKVEHLSNDVVKDASFELRRGEILGFSGLVGSGRTELMRSIFGIDKKRSGEIYLNGKKAEIRNAGDAIRLGIGMIPEDRKKEGLFLHNSIKFNMTIAVLKEFIRFIKVDRKKETGIVNEYTGKLSIKMNGPGQAAGSLSGGNQQKVVISKWLATKPAILIMDEPTRGIDVGAKSEIYALMQKIAKEGISIIMVSSELPEIINVSNRIAVMREGRITKILDFQKDRIDQDIVMHWAAVESE